MTSRNARASGPSSWNSGGGKGQFDRNSEALVMHRPQHPRPLSLLFSSQSVRAPFVLMRDCCQQGDRKWMKVQLVQDVVDRSERSVFLYMR